MTQDRLDQPLHNIRLVFPTDSDFVKRKVLLSIEQKEQLVSKLVFYAQSTSAVLSRRKRAAKIFEIITI